MRFLERWQNRSASENTKDQEVEEKRKQKSLRVIGSIQERGLLSVKDQVTDGQKPFMSKDVILANPRPVVYGRLVIPFDDRFPFKLQQEDRRIVFDDSLTGVIELDEHIRIEEKIPLKYNGNVPEYLLRDALYADGRTHGYFAVLPVIAERQREQLPENLPVSQLEDRFAHSALVVTPVHRLERTQIVDEGQSQGGMEVLSPVVPHTLEKILLPELLGKELQLGLQKTGIPVELVKSTKKKVVGKEMLVPDYESALRQMLEVTGEPLFLHGVRLPTNEDIKKELV